MFFLFLLFPLMSFAVEAPLDPAPRRIRPVFTNENMRVLGFDILDDLPSVSDLKALIQLQTPVKAQLNRGTCSIFASTAMVESLLKIQSRAELDLAENYLQFLVMAKIKSFPSEGSDTDWNIDAFQRYGAILEEAWPYEQYDWNEEDIPTAEKTRRKKMCGNLKEKDKQICFLSHLDPTRDPHVDVAATFGADAGLDTLSYKEISQERQIKKLLDGNTPVVLGVEFFYRAWNHRLMTEYGLGERDMKAWTNGVVSTPDSEDIRVSRKNGAGHSIVIVGYDDERQVYFFKNSWGVSGFGEKSDLLGTDSTAGYGTITYDYAHNFGAFHRVEFN